MKIGCSITRSVPANLPIGQKFVTKSWIGLEVHVAPKAKKIGATLLGSALVGVAVAVAAYKLGNDDNN